MSFTQQDFYKLYFQAPLPHDDAACQAAIEYERNWRIAESPYHISQIRKAKLSYGKSMTDIARKYGTTTKAMREHWRCVDRVLGKDPNEILPYK